MWSVNNEIIFYFYSTQSAARSNKVGLWNDKSPVEPWVFGSSKKQYINNN